MRQKYVIDFSIIEDCFFGQNVNTLKALARFGILIYDRFRGISKQITFLLPSPARSKIKFKKSAKNIKGQALKKEISSIIHDELKDPRIGFITITGVQITPDLRYAKVFFSVLGE